MSERTTPMSLASEDGGVNFGWARQPLFDVNMTAAASARHHLFIAWRLKRWEYFYVATPNAFFAAQVAHLGYLGNVAAYLYDIEHDVLLVNTLNIPFGVGIMMADHPRRPAPTRYTHGAMKYLSQMVGSDRHVILDWPRFNGARDLHADLYLSWPERLESLNVVDPLKKGRFAYTTKVLSMPVSGTIRVGDETWQCIPSQALGELDWSRGFLESVTPWKWATASGRTPQDQMIGFNLCSGFHDGGDNENILVLNGHITKLSAASFTYDQAHIMEPWHVASFDGRVDLSFAPLADRRSDTSAGPLQSHIHQLIGRYTGTVVPEGSDPLAITGFLGAAEDHYARW